MRLTRTIVSIASNIFGLKSCWKHHTTELKCQLYTQWNKSLFLTFSHLFFSSSFFLLERPFAPEKWHIKTQNMNDICLENIISIRSGLIEIACFDKMTKCRSIFFFCASVGVSKKKEKYWCNHIRVVRPPEQIVLYISQFHTKRHKLSKKKNYTWAHFYICIYAFSAQLTILEMDFKCTITTHAIHIYIRKKKNATWSKRLKKTTIRHGMYNTFFLLVLFSTRRPYWIIQLIVFNIYTWNKKPLRSIEICASDAIVETMVPAITPNHDHI